MRPRWAWTAYGAAGLLGLFVVPDKETALFFVFLLGYYPLVKPRLDRIRPAPLRVGAKLLLCNGAVLLLYGLLYLLFPAGQGSDAFQLAAVALAAVTLAIGNAAFLLFDRPWPTCCGCISCCGSPACTRCWANGKEKMRFERGNVDLWLTKSAGPRG